MHSVGKHEKIEENKNFHFREKISQCRKKTERGDPLGFFNIHSVAKHQKKCRGTLWGKFFFTIMSHYNSRVSLHEAPTKNENTRPKPL